MSAVKGLKKEADGFEVSLCFIVKTNLKTKERKVNNKLLIFTYLGYIICMCSSQLCLSHRYFDTQEEMYRKKLQFICSLILKNIWQVIKIPQIRTLLKE